MNLRRSVYVTLTALKYCVFADVIMDMLGNQNMRRIVTNYYEESGEQKLVSKAVATAWEKEKLYNDNTTETDGTLPAKFKTMRLVSIVSS